MSKAEGSVLLIHDFQGVASDFADETSCTECDSRAQAVAEVIEGLQIVQANNAGYFEPMGLRKIQAHFKKSSRLRIVSKDNCVYTWAIVDGDAIRPSPVWCYSCDDSENRENPAAIFFYRDLKNAKDALKRAFRDDCKMFGRDDLDEDETCISKDGMKASLLTIVNNRRINYSVQLVECED